MSMTVSTSTTVSARAPLRAALALSAALLLPGCMALGNVSATPTEYYGGTSAAWDAVVGHGIDPYPWFTEIVALPLEPVLDTVFLPVVAYRRHTDAAAAGDPHHELGD